MGSKGQQFAMAPPTPKIDIDEYFSVLKEKIRTNSHEIKTKFRNADPDGKGGVTKEALAHILAAVFGPSKPLSHQHFVKLLERMDLKSRHIIKFFFLGLFWFFCWFEISRINLDNRFDDFIACFQANKSDLSSEWVDPIRAASSMKSSTASARKAVQVFIMLKEKANLKWNWIQFDCDIFE